MFPGAPKAFGFVTFEFPCHVIALTRSKQSLEVIRNQIQSVLTKLGVTSQLEAVALARRAGWAPDDPI